ncbi:LlaJI family restriction endonuclease [Pontibacillus sp. HMF3514]|uniref:LlaJI family restriction endonuclease n=1 Tax=Pontibacillus sp. HMF3514 TaxID=2692425 RepID=UPI001F3C2935|nr:LlaJI family restriction endonuclease [Pontibacillus sp. HMF3514]
MVIFLKELQPYTELELKRNLNLNDQEWGSFILDMQRKGMLEWKRDAVYSFSYVGFMEWGQRFVFFFPKYKATQDPYYMELLINLFMEYAKRENLDEHEVETLGDMTAEKDFNFLTTADFLLQDYFENGLYINEKMTHELNGEGEINWNQTIEEHEAYISKGRPFYLDLVTVATLNDEEDFIRLIHKYVLTVCSRYMKQLSFIDIFDYPPLEFEVEWEDIGTLEHALYMIENEMQQQFSDQKLLILKTLYFFLTREKGANADDQLKLLGTRTFHVVWEKVLGYVLQNQYDHYKKFIPNPIWTDAKTGRQSETDTLIPDILHDNKAKKHFYIIDAKYYTTTFDENGKLKNNVPGVGDVSKQYLYEQALKQSSQFEGYEWFNIFAMPTEQMTEKFGSVHLSFMGYMKDIELIRVNTSFIYNQYLKRKQVFEFLYL